jgi:hypothetical protein
MVMVISHRPIDIGIMGKEGEGIRDIKKQQEVGITTETAKTRGDK